MSLSYSECQGWTGRCEEYRADSQQGPFCRVIYTTRPSDTTKNRQKSTTVFLCLFSSSFLTGNLGDQTFHGWRLLSFSSGFFLSSSLLRALGGPWCNLRDRTRHGMARSLHKQRAQQHVEGRTSQSSAPPRSKQVLQTILEVAGGVDGPCKGDPQLVASSRTTPRRLMIAN